MAFWKRGCVLEYCFALPSIRRVATLYTCVIIVDVTESVVHRLTRSPLDVIVTCADKSESLIDRSRNLLILRYATDKNLATPSARGNDIYEYIVQIM